MEPKHSFICGCCDRERLSHMIADSVIEDKKAGHLPLCKQCQGFLKVGLPPLVSKLEAENKKLLDDPERAAKFSSEFVQSETPASPASTDLRSMQQTLATPKEKKASKPRLASASECDIFAHRSLALAKYIEGFIKGLEAAGLDRSQLRPEKINAINNLMGISQKLTSERLHVIGRTESRSNVRKLTRHIKETSIMVNEYISAVSDSR